MLQAREQAPQGADDGDGVSGRGRRRPECSHALAQRLDVGGKVRSAFCHKEDAD